MKHARLIRPCKKGTKGEKPRPRSHRPRTADEIKSTRPICRVCPHYLAKPTETLDAGVCLLRAKGCGACKSLEQFARYIAAGNRCPDGRFEGTEIVE